MDILMIGEDEMESLTEKAGWARFDFNAELEILAERRTKLDRQRDELNADSGGKLDAGTLAKRRAGIQKLADESLLLDEAEIPILERIIAQWPAALDKARRDLYDAAIAQHDAIKAATVDGLEKLGWLPAGNAQGRHASQTSEIASRTCPKIHAAAAGVEDALQATQRRFDVTPFRRRIEQLRAGIAKSMAA